MGNIHCVAGGTFDLLHRACLLLIVLSSLANARYIGIWTITFEAM